MNLTVFKKIAGINCTIIPRKEIEGKQSAHLRFVNIYNREIISRVTLQPQLLRKYLIQQM
ncbi:MAG: hypothetical protein ACI4EH_07600 [Oliverpabstia sp.]